ncbi:MAG: flippase-like domain-containing protein, partial [Acidobacteriota bacterium]|nr:flippase-like domain-containing protein [Acidobacteriota bacterium]
YYQRNSEPIINWTEKFFDRKFIPRRIQALISSILRQLAISLKILRDWREIVGVTFWTILLWFSIALPTWFVILAFDLPVKVGFGDSLFVMFVAALGSVVPTPGGAAGAFHAATAGSLIFLGVDTEKAAAISIAMHLVYFAPAVFFGLYYILRGDASLTRLKGLLSGEHAVEEIEHETDDGQPLSVVIQ